MRLSGQLVALAILASACVHDGDAAPATDFNYSTVVSGRFGLVVHAANAGLPGVRVTIRTVESPTEFAPGVLYQGVTDAEGRAQGLLSLRADQRQVEVTLQRAGYTGPYSDPSKRATFGAFSPSAWLVVGVGALASLDVPFTRSAP